MGSRCASIRTSRRVGECRELIFTKGNVGKIFDLRKHGGNRTVNNGYFIPLSPQPQLPANNQTPLGITSKLRDFTRNYQQTTRFH